MSRRIGMEALAAALFAMPADKVFTLSRRDEIEEPDMNVRQPRPAKQPPAIKTELSASDMDAIRRAEEKRARKAAKLGARHD